MYEYVYIYIYIHTYHYQSDKQMNQFESDTTQPCRAFQQTRINRNAALRSAAPRFAALRAAPSDGLARLCKRLTDVE